MLKKSSFSPAQPRRAETRLSSCFVLGSSKSSTHPTRGKGCSDSSGLDGWERYASGFDSPAVLLGKRRVSARRGWVGEMSGLFERPAGYSEESPCEHSQHLAAQKPSFPQTDSVAGVLTS